MRRAAALILTAALIACAAPPEDKPMPPPAPHMDRLPAPVPANAPRQITKDDAGKTITLSVGEKAAVALVGTPTAGYLWAPAKTPEVLKLTEETGGPTTEAQKQPGFAGGNHWEVFVFEAVKAGKGELTLEQQRPWLKGKEPPADTFAVKIEVK